MNNEYLQAALLALDTLGLMLIIIAPIFTVGMIGYAYWLSSQDGINEFQPTKEERKKGFDYVNMRNPRNFKLVNFPLTKRETSDAKEWRAKADFVLGKKVADQLIAESLQHDFSRKSDDDHSWSNASVTFAPSPTKREP
ncbi:hypothetical protein RYA05_04645 [Pseudomonas syringae pv. actinidiae]|nr:hypothetical protein [Pseudomonas syringae pv. actinidiae]